MTLTYFDNASRCCLCLAIKLAWTPDIPRHVPVFSTTQTLKSYQSSWDVPYVPTFPPLSQHCQRKSVVALPLMWIAGSRCSSWNQRSPQKHPKNQNPWQLWTCPTASLPVHKAIETMTRVSYPTTRRETDLNSKCWQDQANLLCSKKYPQVFLRFKQ